MHETCTHKRSQSPGEPGSIPTGSTFRTEIIFANFANFVLRETYRETNPALKDVLLILTEPPRKLPQTAVV